MEEEEASEVGEFGVGDDEGEEGWEGSEEGMGILDTEEMEAKGMRDLPVHGSSQEAEHEQAPDQGEQDLDWRF